MIGQRWESERPTPLYWKKFYAKANQWNEIDRPLRYVCTHSLTVKSSVFHEVGGFRECFTSYGFEDGEFCLSPAPSGRSVFADAFSSASSDGWHSSPRMVRVPQFSAGGFYKQLVAFSTDHHTLKRGFCTLQISVLSAAPWLNRLSLVGSDYLRRVVAKFRKGDQTFAQGSEFCRS